MSDYILHINHLIYFHFRLINEEEHNYQDEQDNDTNHGDKDQIDASKLEKLVYGYRSRPNIIKQQTSDFSGTENDKDFTNHDNRDDRKESES